MPIDELAHLCSYSKDMWYPCDPDTFDKSVGFRGVGRDEAKKALYHLRAEPQHPDSLIGNDWEVLEYGYREHWLEQDLNDEQIEKFLQRIVPDWAHREGVNMTSDFENAKGYAQARGDGFVLVFDLSEVTSIFEPSEHHMQLQYPKEAVLLAVCDRHGEHCECFKRD